MGFFKKNLGFCIFVLICVLACAGGVYLTMAETDKVKKAQLSITSNQTQLNSLLYASPAPTVANVEAAEENVAQLTDALRTIREDLQRGSRLSASTDGVNVMAGLQQFIFEYQKRVAAHTDADGQPAPITISEDFAFGFEQYADEAAMVDDPEKIATLDKQRQILSYLLTQLIESNPQSINSVEREVLELEETKGFVIDPVISARVPGAIDTMAYSLSFSGYTSSLRSLLNNLAKFDLPIVVRSIAVERPSGSETVVAPQGNNLDDIFGIFGDSGAETEAEPQEAQKPVIEENVSSFTVIVEFIEVVLPDASNELS